tara:strand:- start:616 stop:1806 length:1191 start_codon:yes stop_codon:yes gene_type:complete
LNYSSLSDKTLIYTQVKEIPKNIWDELGCTTNLYFSSEYLEAIERNNSHLTFFYIIIKNEEHHAIAFASAQIIDFYLNTIESGLTSFLKKVTSIARKLKIIPKEKPLRILNCGNSFVSGEHGIFIKDSENKRGTLKKISKSILHYTQQNEKENPIDIFMMKDFLAKSLHISNELISSGYYSFNIEPNMSLKIEDNWKNFEDYLVVLKTKFRVKAKKALKLSNNLIVKEITADNFAEQVKEMTELYKGVASKADFNLGEFKLETYKSLKEKLGNNYILKSYWLENKMVGFMSGIINKNELDAHFVGIDYKLNREYAIYQRMLYDYIYIAISKKLKILNFGRTASEIKSSVGATPEHLTVYIRHKKSITNKFLKLFLLKIQPTEFNQKFPFKIDKKNL